MNVSVFRLGYIHCHADGHKDRRPEDILGDLAVHAQGATRPGKLLQQVGAATLVGSVGFRGLNALMGRHCTARSWQRYKRELKQLPQAESSGFSALKQVDGALARFESLKMANFHTPPTTDRLPAQKTTRRRK